MSNSRNVINLLHDIHITPFLSFIYKVILLVHSEDVVRNLQKDLNFS